MDGRTKPFDEVQLIDVVPYSFVNLSDGLASAVQKVACRQEKTLQRVLR